MYILSLNIFINAVKIIKFVSRIKKNEIKMKMNQRNEKDLK